MSAQYPSAEDNKAVVRGFWKEVYDERNVDEMGKTVNKLVDPDYEFRTPNPPEEKLAATC